jgi:hypothetical protein
VNTTAAVVVFKELRSQSQSMQNIKRTHVAHRPNRTRKNYSMNY